MIGIIGHTGMIGTYLKDQLQEVVTIGRDKKSDIIMDLQNVGDVDLNKIDTLVYCSIPISSETMFQFEQLLRRVEACKVKRVIFVSTASDRKDYYTLYHRVMEEMIRIHRTPYIIIRVSNVYGMPNKNPHFRWHLAPYAFPLMAVKNQRIVIDNEYGMLNLVNVHRVVDGIYSACLGKVENYITEITGEAMTVTNFAKLCAMNYAAVAKKKCVVVPRGMNFTPVQDLGLPIYLESFYKKYGGKK
jgi:nucleoside-diphosphate-sugar epimerase